MNIKDKIALVTGAASGIGLAIVKELLVNEVGGVVMVDLDPITGKEAQDNFISTYGQKVVFVKADVCNAEQYEAAFKTAICQFDHLDIVVNNAGIANDVDYEKLIAINLTSVVRGTLLGLKYLGKNKSNKEGVILSTSSITAIEDEHALPVYSATKAGVVNLMRGFGHSYYYEENGIRTLAILPGFTTTNIISTFKTIGEDEKFIRVITDRSVQTATSVAKGAMHVIKNGNPGSTWIIDDSKLYLLAAPQHGDYGTLIKDNLNQCSCKTKPK